MPKELAAAWARFVMRVELIPYLVLTVIGVAVLYVVGGIAFTALQHGSLIPPPAKLVVYDCAGPAGAFSILYLHGGDRVQIKSASGMLDGSLSKNRVDWNGFANDRNVLGFAPPAEIVLADASSLRVNGPDQKNLSCTMALAPASQRGAIY